MRHALGYLLRKSGGACYRLGTLVSPPPGHVQSLRVRPFLDARGDKTLRLFYDLNADSLVLDLGGYEGQWASDIYAMYGCRIHVFEPVTKFATDIRRRFALNTRIMVHEFGLADRNDAATISIEADASSMFKRGSMTCELKLVRASEYFETEGIKHVDLMKINIEGGEYDLLDHLIESGWAKRIENIQVQFHDFVPDAERRMRSIQARLATTHTTTYQYPFVWENWRLIQSPDAASVAQAHIAEA
jgi:FkbM family methyltransferase